MSVIRTHEGLLKQHRDLQRAHKDLELQHSRLQAKFAEMAVRAIKADSLQAENQALVQRLLELQGIK